MDKKLIILNPKGLERLGMITDYSSVTFKNESQDDGSFELWCPLTENNLELIKDENIVYLSKRQTGIIQYIKEVISEDGSKTLNVKGKTTKFYASYRVFMKQYNASNQFVTNIMNEVITQNFISPTDIKRKMVSLELSPDTEYGKGEQITIQQTGNHVSDFLSDLVVAHNCSYDFELDIQRKMLQFKARANVDRSIDQLLVEPVILSSNLNDLIDSEYTKNTVEEKNVVLVAGQGEGAARKTTFFGDTEKSDVDRKEMYIDARDISTLVTNNEGVQSELSDTEYEKLLIERGNAKRSEAKKYEGFDATLNTSQSSNFKFGVDFFLGDIITIEDKKLGLRTNAEVTAIEEIYSGTDGHSIKIILGYLQPNLVKKLKSVKAEVNSSQSVSKLENKVNDIEVITESHSTAINTIETDVSGTKQTVANIQQSVTTITNDVDGLKTTTSDMSQKVNTIEDTAESHTQSISSINSRVDTVVSDVTGLQTQQASTTTKVNSIESTVNGTTQTVSEIQNDLTDLSGSVDTRFSQINQTASGIQTQVSSISTDYVSKAAAATTEQNLKDYSDGKLSNYATTMAATVTSLQGQIDGSITTWFYAVAPTSSNVPAVNWTTTDMKNNHLGDLYYDTITGYCYRYQVINNTYNWQRLTDTDVTKALSDAATAKDVADSKRRTFLSTPTVPYDAGDLWTQGASGDTMMCIVSRSTGSYISSDWVKASKYTDDTAVNNLQIGGRNLVLNSNRGTASLFSGQSNGKYVTSAVSALGVATATKLTCSVASTGWQISYASVNKPLLKANQKYTVSFDVYSTVATSLALYIMETTGLNCTCNFGSKSIPANTWTKVVITATSNSTVITNQVLYITGCGAVGEYTFVNLKLEEGDKALPWTPAPEDVAADITTAQTNATNALAQLTDIMSDSKITPDEKQLLYKEWLTIVSEKTLNDAQADTFGITTEKATYGTKYTALSTYVNTTYPLFSDLTTTTTIDSGATLRTRYKEYYDARTGLLNAIATKAKTNLDNLKIGGKQLLLGTDGSWDVVLDAANTNQTKMFQTIIPSWVASKTDIFGGTLALRLLPTSANQYFAANQYCNKPCKVVGTYTFSFYVRADSATTLRIGNRTTGTTTDTYKTVNLTTAWQRVSKTFVVTGTITSHHVWMYSDSAVPIEISHMQVEDGDKVTPWKLAPEEVQKQITDAASAASTAVGTATAANNAIIETNAALETAKASIAALQSSMTTLTQTSNDFTFNIQQSLAEVINDASNALSMATTTNSYMKLEVIDSLMHIKIGTDVSKFALDICNNKIVFLVNNQETAYFSNNKMYIKDVELLENGVLKMGRFAFVPRSNGNLDFKFVG